MSEQLKAVKGMNDILPPESARWEWFEATVRRVMQRYAYQNVRTPIVEPTPLFVRGLGEVTDIVEKEMYSFEDKLNGDQLTLRPEGTAGVVRAVNEHSCCTTAQAPVLHRRDVPPRASPAGRYRQFHQVGVEALGFPARTGRRGHPDGRALWRELGLTDVRLEINSLGQPAERWPTAPR
jgi:histidyl-tRNA synthetase